MDDGRTPRTAPKITTAVHVLVPALLSVILACDAAPDAPASAASPSHTQPQPRWVSPDAVPASRVGVAFQQDPGSVLIEVFEVPAGRVAPDLRAAWLHTLQEDGPRELDESRVMILLGERILSPPLLFLREFPRAHHSVFERGIAHALTEHRPPALPHPSTARVRILAEGNTEFRWIMKVRGALSRAGVADFDLLLRGPAGGWRVISMPTDT